MAETKSTKKSSPSSVEIPPVSELGMELGVDVNLPFTTPFQPQSLGIAKSEDEKLLEVGRETLEDAGPTVRQLVTMRRLDGQARALYRLFTLPIRSALSSATFVPEDGGEAEAKYIEDVFRTPPESGGMSVTLHRFMSQMLQGVFDGFSAFEKVFWRPDHGPLKGKITLKKLAYRPADTVTFIADEDGGFAGFRQRAYVAGKSVDVFIPQKYAFYYAAQEEERKFYGISFFQSAFYHYDKKVKLYYLAHLAAQRAAVGTRVGTVPANAGKAAKDEFIKSLAKLSVAQWMAVPEGFKVEILREAGSFDYLSLVNHHNSQMSKSILAAFFDKDQGAGKSEGSLVNFATPGDDMFVLMLRAIMDDVANQINHYIIPQLIDFNFKGGKYPKFTWGKLTDEQKSAIAATFDKLATAGQSVNVTPEFIRELEKQQAAEFGLELDYVEIEAREKEASDQAAAQLAQDAVAVDPDNPNLEEGGNSEDDAIDSFQQQAMSLSSMNSYEDLLRMAGEMLDVVESGSK